MEKYQNRVSGEREYMGNVYSLKKTLDGALTLGNFSEIDNGDGKDIVKVLVYTPLDHPIAPGVATRLAGLEDYLVVMDTNENPDREYVSFRPDIILSAEKGFIGIFSDGISSRYDLRVNCEEDLVKVLSRTHEKVKKGSAGEIHVEEAL